MNMTLTALNVYPLKSAAGIALDAAELDDFGLRYDRRWMVVDGTGRFVSQREEPRLSLVRTRIGNDALFLDFDGLTTLALPLVDGSTVHRRVTVWRDTVDACDAGDEAARWLSEAFGQRCRIVHMPGNTVRAVDTRYDVGNHRVAFSDGFPLLLISQGSLDELNTRLPVPLPMNRFRPNLVVAGCAPHAEDTWRRIRIGSVDLAVVKPCARCVATTVDQATGVTGKEPLRTLATYRKEGNNVFFGQNVIHLTRGQLRIGDALHVTETKE
jgi:uncharacterized protein YcbX